MRAYRISGGVGRVGVDGCVGGAAVGLSGLGAAHRRLDGHLGRDGRGVRLHGAVGVQHRAQRL